MTLATHATTKGLWQAPGQSTGVHALIIGVSDYPHLEGGSGSQAALTGGMPQLEVSAVTAARVFQWLRNRGAAGGAPLASCRLLLGPRSSEQNDVDVLSSGWYANTTFRSIRDATERWGDALAAGAGSDEPNVALFFFSGHGVEHLASPALLAQDVLDPNSERGPYNAVAFNSLWQSVKTFGVDRAFFFVDACRNAPDVARLLNIVGQSVLEPKSYGGRAPEAVAWLQATRVGDFAYQVKGADATIFGQALLETLEGMPPDSVPYDRSVTPWKLVFGQLESQVKQNVRTLLRKQSATILQPVQPGGDPYNSDALVAQKPSGPVVSGIQPEPSGAQPPPEDVEHREEREVAKVVAERANETLRSFNRSFFPENPFARDQGGLTDYADMHQILGHESIAGPWVSHLQIEDLRTGAPIERHVMTLGGGRSHEGAGLLTAWVDLSIAPGAGQGVWISNGGTGGSEGAFAVAIPRDAETAFPLRLDLTFSKAPDRAWSLQSMSARLGPPEYASGVRNVWRSLWEVQRIETLSSLGQAADALERLQVLEDALDDKDASPLGAAVAAALLLRAGALERLHEWPRNLANRFPWLADGPILWAETLLRREELEASQRRRTPGSQRQRALDPTPEFEEAFNFFVEVANRGSPLLAPVLAMAARQAELWQFVLEAKRIGPSAARAVEAASSTIKRAVDYAVPDSLFVAFASRTVALKRSEVLGVYAHAEEAIAAA
jgi:hypothetical protein